MGAWFCDGAGPGLPSLLVLTAGAVWSRGEGVGPGTNLEAVPMSALPCGVDCESASLNSRH